MGHSKNRMLDIVYHVQLYSYTMYSTALGTEIECLKCSRSTFGTKTTAINGSFYIANTICSAVNLRRGLAKNLRDTLQCNNGCITGQ